MDFTESRLHNIETRREAYKQLVYSMFLADNLGYLRAYPVKLDELTEGVIIFDEETGKSWVIAILHVRVRA